MSNVRRCDDCGRWFEPRYSLPPDEETVCGPDCPGPPPDVKCPKCGLVGRLYEKKASLHSRIGTHILGHVYHEGARTMCKLNKYELTRTKEGNDD